MFRRRLLEKAISCLSQFQYTTFENKAKILFRFWGKASLAIGETETEFLLKIARETNLILAAREARAEPHKHWAALSAALQNRSQKSESFFLVSLYSEARTFFEENF